MSFGNRGIPSLGNIGVYDSSTNQAVGGSENPYPASYPSKPTISGLYGQDTMSDNFPNLNFFAGGEVHGPGGYDKPSEGLLRGVEFVATYFSYAVASDSLGGKVDKPNRPIAYFEQIPKKATATTTVTYDAGFSRDANGDTDGLEYYWDFGDGSAPQKTNLPKVTHTFPTQAGWHDVKLMVSKGDGTKTTTNVGDYRQVEPINFAPTYYPATPPAGEPQPPTTGPTTEPVRAAERSDRARILPVRVQWSGAGCAGFRTAPVTGTVPATLGLTLGGPATFGAFATGRGEEPLRCSTTRRPTWSRRPATRRSAALGPNHLTNNAFTMPQPFTAFHALEDELERSRCHTIRCRSASISRLPPTIRCGPVSYSATVVFTLSTTTP